jgi:hypothetical protein
MTALVQRKLPGELVAGVFGVALLLEGFDLGQRKSGSGRGTPSSSLRHSFFRCRLSVRTQLFGVPKMRPRLGHRIRSWVGGQRF